MTEFFSGIAQIAPVVIIFFLGIAVVHLEKIKKSLDSIQSLLEAKEHELNF